MSRSVDLSPEKHASDRALERRGEHFEQPVRLVPTDQLIAATLARRDCVRGSNLSEMRIVIGM